MAKKNRKKAAVLKKLQKERRLAKLERLRAILNRNFGYEGYKAPEPEPIKGPYLRDLFPKHTPVEAIWLAAQEQAPWETRPQFRQFTL